MEYISPGAIHIHSKYSDGSSDIKTIAKKARQANLAWIIITDHNNLEGLRNNEEGFYDNVLVLIGNEISPEPSDHYLAFNVNKETDTTIGAQEFIYDVKKQGGFGFVAHPDESRERENHYKPLRWTDWSTKDFDGIEIWNWASDWVDGYTPKNAILHTLFRHHRMSGPTKATLEWWDKTNNNTNRIIPAIGGVDAHALPVRKGPLRLKFADYYDTFRSISNMILLKDHLSDDFDSAKAQVLGAIQQGNNFIVNRFWNKKSDFPIFYAKTPTQKAYPGEKLRLEKKAKIIAKIPKKASMRLIYNGQLIWEYETTCLEFNKLDVGKYRLEVYYKERPWIFSNPIQICED